MRSDSTPKRSVLGQLVLLGPHHALDHGVDRLEMRGVGGQGHGQLGPRCRATKVAAGPLVVLDVTRALDRVGVEIALELAEDLAVGLAHDVGQDVQPAPVGHPEDRLGRTRRRRASSSRASRSDDGRFGPFEAEPLLAHVAGVEEALEGLGRVEPVEDVALLTGSRVAGRPRRGAGSTASAQDPGCACTRWPVSGSRRRAGCRAPRPA